MNLDLYFSVPFGFEGRAGSAVPALPPDQPADRGGMEQNRTPDRHAKKTGIGFAESFFQRVVSGFVACIKRRSLTKESLA